MTHACEKGMYVWVLGVHMLYVWVLGVHMLYVGVGCSYAVCVGVGCSYACTCMLLFFSLKYVSNSITVNKISTTVSESVYIYIKFLKMLVL